MPWTRDDQALWDRTLEELAKNPQAAITYIQFKLTERQIEAQEKLAQSMSALAALMAEERGLVKLPEAESTRGPGRMRR